MDRTLIRALVAACGLLAAGCAGARVPAQRPGPFAFARDTFAFVNESHRVLVDDPVSGRRVWTDRTPPPDFALHCQGMARAARQFRVHARFDPTAPAADEARTRDLVRAVLASDPRAPAATGPLVVIPGFPDLRAFSAAHEALLKAEIQRDWRSTVARGDWRIVVPALPSWQKRTAEALRAEIAGGATPIVRVFRFPAITLNHALLVFGVAERDGDLVFEAYDPNDAAAPMTFRFDAARRSFVYPPRFYFAGGPVKVYEIYGGLSS